MSENREKIQEESQKLFAQVEAPWLKRFLLDIVINLNGIYNSWDIESSKNMCLKEAGDKIDKIIKMLDVFIKEGRQGLKEKRDSLKSLWEEASFCDDQIKFRALKEQIVELVNEISPSLDIK